MRLFSPRDRGFAAALPLERSPSRKDWERFSRIWAVDLDRRIGAFWPIDGKNSAGASKPLV